MPKSYRKTRKKSKKRNQKKGPEPSRPQAPFVWSVVNPSPTTTFASIRGHSSPDFSTAKNADCGSSTSPTIFMRFLPSFCFLSSAHPCAHSLRPPPVSGFSRKLRNQFGTASVPCRRLVYICLQDFVKALGEPAVADVQNNHLTQNDRAEAANVLGAVHFTATLPAPLQSPTGL